MGIALVDEERATALGNLMQLNGPAGYPFTRSRTADHITWPEFKALYYQAKGRSLLSSNSSRGMPKARCPGQVPSHSNMAAQSVAPLPRPK